MPWSTAVRSDLNDIIALLLKEERDHVFLSSYFFNGGKPVFPAKTSGKTLIHRTGGMLDAVVFISFGGIMLPAFEPNALPASEWNGLKSYMKNSSRKIFSLLGREDRVQVIEEILPYKSSEHVPFQIFSKEQNLSEPKDLPPGFSIKKATRLEVNHLFQLEEAYQLEEVYTNAENLDSGWLKMHFLKQLKEQNVLYIDFGGRAVAKGGTNAIGCGYAQFGGVYTHPDFRKRGLSTILVDSLCRWQEEQGRHACLFVKKTNTAAIRVYEKTGFESRDPFRITYFR